MPLTHPFEITHDTSDDDIGELAATIFAANPQYGSVEHVKRGLESRREQRGSHKQLKIERAEARDKIVAGMSRMQEQAASKLLGGN